MILDALDQLDDKPTEEERIFVALRGEVNQAHVDRVVNRRRVGEWFYMVEYAKYSNQPGKEILENTEAYRAWCFEEVEKNREKGKEQGSS